MPSTPMLEAVIAGYRHVIEKRYQYAALHDRYELPASLDETTINQLRDYFLNYVYPPIDKREELNEAFDSLNAHLKHPTKLLGLLIDSFKLSFKYGRHLPKILTTGLTAFHSFQAANEFEEQLVEQAVIHQIESPFDVQKVYALIKYLPKHKIEAFIESFKSVFETLYDTELIQKIKEVLGYLLVQMDKHPQRYSQEERKGLQIGLDILTEGDNIFQQLSTNDQHQLIPLIVQIERDALEEIFSAEIN